MKRAVIVISAIGAMLLASQVSAHDPAQDPAQFGKVTFPTSCNPAVQARFEAAVAMLHSFFYPETVRAFQAVVEADSQCAMGYWGLAASQRPNPLVPPWPDDNLKRALAAIEKGKAVAATARDRDWLGAIEAAYKDYDKVPNTTRSERYEEAMAALAKKYPDDKEAAIFYALALLEAVDHADKTYRRQLAAGEILEKVEREQPDHPGLAHYIIHAYDFARRARRAIGRQIRLARPSGTARAAHAVAHLFDAGTVGELDPFEPERGRRLARLCCEELPRHDVCAGAACTGFHGLRLPAARSGSRGEARGRRGRCYPQL